MHDLFHAPAAYDLFADSQPPPNVEILVPDSDDQLDNAQRKAKRERIEEYARQYLKGFPLFIQSANLEGPFDNGWLNPWRRKSKRATDQQATRQISKPFTSTSPATQRRRSAEVIEADEGHFPAKRFCAGRVNATLNRAEQASPEESKLVSEEYVRNWLKTRHDGGARRRASFDRATPPPQDEEDMAVVQPPESTPSKPPLKPRGVASSSSIDQAPSRARSLGAAAQGQRTTRTPISPVSKAGDLPLDNKSPRKSTTPRSPLESSKETTLRTTTGTASKTTAMGPPPRVTTTRDSAATLSPNTNPAAATSMSTRRSPSGFTPVNPQTTTSSRIRKTAQVSPAIPSDAQQDAGVQGDNQVTRPERLSSPYRSASPTSPKQTSPGRALRSKSSNTAQEYPNSTSTQGFAWKRKNQPNGVHGADTDPPAQVVPQAKTRRRVSFESSPAVTAKGAIIDKAKSNNKILQDRNPTAGAQHNGTTNTDATNAIGAVATSDPTKLLRTALGNSIVSADPNSAVVANTLSFGPEASDPHTLSSLNEDFSTQAALLQAQRNFQNAITPLHMSLRSSGKKKMSPTETNGGTGGGGAAALTAITPFRAFNTPPRDDAQVSTQELFDAARGMAFSTVKKPARKEKKRASFVDEVPTTAGAKPDDDDDTTVQADPTNPAARETPSPRTTRSSASKTYSLSKDVDSQVTERENITAPSKAGSQSRATISNSFRISKPLSQPKSAHSSQSSRKRSSQGAFAAQTEWKPTLSHDSGPDAAPSPLASLTQSDSVVRPMSLNDDSTLVPCSSQDAQRVRDSALSFGAASHQDGDADIDAAVDDCSGFLDSWDIEKDVLRSADGSAARSSSALRRRSARRSLGFA